MFVATKIKSLHLQSFTIFQFSSMLSDLSALAICTSISNFLLCFYTDVNFASQYMQNYMSQLEFQPKSVAGKENDM